MLGQQRTAKVVGDHSIQAGRHTLGVSKSCAHQIGKRHRHRSQDAVHTSVEEAAAQGLDSVVDGGLQALLAEEVVGEDQPDPPAAHPHPHSEIGLEAGPEPGLSACAHLQTEPSAFRMRQLSGSQRFAATRSSAQISVAGKVARTTALGLRSLIARTLGTQLSISFSQQQESNGLR